MVSAVTLGLARAEVVKFELPTVEVSNLRTREP
jgi:hypothetical protein